MIGKSLSLPIRIPTKGFLIKPPLKTGMMENWNGGMMGKRLRNIFCHSSIPIFQHSIFP
jgi:hypothetical protein